MGSTGHLTIHTSLYTMLYQSGFVYGTEDSHPGALPGQPMMSGWRLDGQGR